MKRNTLLSIKNFFLYRFFSVIYWFINKFDKQQNFIFMNYGYSNCDELELSEKDERNRYSIQLYNFIINHIDINGLDVLEVGSGRGGGADFTTRTYKPKSYKGVDLSKRAIKFSNKKYANKTLSFVRANAQHLPFQNNCFDVVVNIESSHGYPDFGKFFNEVYRVLKPDGYFLFADFRMIADNSLWRVDTMDETQNKISDSKFKVIHRKTITPNIVKALDLFQERRLEQISSLIPNFILITSWINKIARNFAAIKGSFMYETFKDGKCEYFFYMFQK